MLRFVVLSCCVMFTLFCAADIAGGLGCGKNAEMKCIQVGVGCHPQKTCRNRDEPIKCMPSMQPCHHECTCKPGFLWNAVGDCISNEECDMCQRKNEFFACGSACDNECAKLSTQNRTKCPIKSLVCNRKCYCEDGFARDDKGDCIPVEQCRQL